MPESSLLPRTKYWSRWWFKPTLALFNSIISINVTRITLYSVHAINYIYYLFRPMEFSSQSNIIMFGRSIVCRYGKCYTILNICSLPKKDRQTVQVQIRLRLRSSLIKVFPVSYSNKHFVNSSPDNCIYWQAWDYNFQTILYFCPRIFFFVLENVIKYCKMWHFILVFYCLPKYLFMGLVYTMG